MSALSKAFRDSVIDKRSPSSQGIFTRRAKWSSWSDVVTRLIYIIKLGCLAREYHQGGQIPRETRSPQNPQSRGDHGEQKDHSNNPFSNNSSEATRECRSARTLSGGGQEKILFIDKCGTRTGINKEGKGTTEQPARTRVATRPTGQRAPLKEISSNTSKGKKNPAKAFSEATAAAVVADKAADDDDGDI